MGLFDLLNKKNASVLAFIEEGSRFHENGQFALAVESFEKALSLDPGRYDAWVGRGASLFYLDRYSDAVTSFDKAIEIDQRKPGAWKNRGRALHELGRTAEAVESYEKALESDPGDADTVLYRGRALHELGRPADAVESFDQILKTDHNNPDVWFRRGVALDELEEYTQSVASYDHALAIDPSHAVGWYNRGVALERLSRPQDAMESYQRALEIAPDHPGAQRNLRVLIGQMPRATPGTTDEVVPSPIGVESLPDAVSPQPHPDLTFSPDKPLQESEEAEAYTEDVLKSPDLSGSDELPPPDLTLSGEEAAEDPIDPEPIEEKADWPKTAMKYASEGRFEEAVSAYDRALEDDSDSVYLHIGRGLALEYLEQHQEAIESFDRAIELNPENAKVWYNRGLALQHLRRYDDAIDSYDRALAIDSHLSAVRRKRDSAIAEKQMLEGRVVSEAPKKPIYERFLSNHLNAGDQKADPLPPPPSEQDEENLVPVPLSGMDLSEAAWDEADSGSGDPVPEEIEAFDTLSVAGSEEAEGVSPGSPRSGMDEAVPDPDLPEDEAAAFAAAVPLHEAPEADDSAPSPAADDPSGWYRRGVSLLRQELFEEAADAFDHAIQLDPAMPDIWNDRGVALAQLGQHDEAMRSYNRALLLDPLHCNSWMNKARSQAECGRPADAVESYDRALAMNPGDASAWYNRGVLLAEIGRGEESTQCLDKALAIGYKTGKEWYTSAPFPGYIDGYTDCAESDDTEEPVPSSRDPSGGGEFGEEDEADLDSFAALPDISDDLSAIEAAMAAPEPEPMDFADPDSDPEPDPESAPEPESVPDTDTKPSDTADIGDMDRAPDSDADEKADDTWAVAAAFAPAAPAPTPASSSTAAPDETGEDVWDEDLIASDTEPLIPPFPDAGADLPESWDEDGMAENEMAEEYMDDSDSFAGIPDISDDLSAIEAAMMADEPESMDFADLDITDIETEPEPNRAPVPDAAAPDAVEAADSDYVFESEPEGEADGARAAGDDLIPEAPAPDSAATSPPDEAGEDVWDEDLIPSDTEPLIPPFPDAGADLPESWDEDGMAEDDIAEDDIADSDSFAAIPDISDDLSAIEAAMAAPDPGSLDVADFDMDLEPESDTAPDPGDAVADVVDAADTDMQFDTALDQDAGDIAPPGGKGGMALYGAIEPGSPPDADEVEPAQDESVAAADAPAYDTPVSPPVLVEDAAGSLPEEGGAGLEPEGSFSEILKYYDRAAARSPDDADIWYNRGLVLYNLRRYRDAVASFERAVALNPEYAEAERNRRILVALIQKNISDYERKGTEHATEGRYEEALMYYDEVISLDPGAASVWYNRGVALRQLGRYDEAVESYDRALALAPDDPCTWFNRGVALRNLGRHDDAIESYDRALTLDPEDADTWHNRGVALRKLGRNADAVASFDRALSINSTDAAIWYNRGIALRQLGRYDNALESYDQMLALEPENILALNNRGFLLNELVRHQEAAESYNRSILLDPESADGWVGRGIAEFNLGHYADAVESLTRALGIDPDDSYSWQVHGLSLARLDRHADAVESYDRAIAIDPDDARIWVIRGLSLMDIGSYHDALLSFERAIELDPGNPDLPAYRDEARALDTSGEGAQPEGADHSIDAGEPAPITAHESRQPSLPAADFSVILDHSRFIRNQWHRVPLTIKNADTVPLIDLSISFSEDFMTKRLIPVTVPPGGQVTIDIGIKPLSVGMVPLDLRADYHDEIGEEYTRIFEFWIEVVPEG